MRTEDWGRPDKQGEQGEDDGLLMGIAAAVIVGSWMLVARFVRFLGFHD